MADVVVVTGPPCSGKTTWARREAELYGGMVVDWDLLMCALSPDGQRYDPRHNSHLAPYVAAAQNALFRQLTASSNGRPEPPAWVVTTKRGADLDWFARKLGADVHVMDTDRETCLRRLKDDPDGRDPSYARSAIDDWFESSSVNGAAVSVEGRSSRDW